MPIHEKKIQLSEIFTSIEGEGILFGTKTMFVRMAGCHLKCYWCDTNYALAMNSGNTYSIDQVKKMMKEQLQNNTYKINFTGGEPLIQYEAVKDLAKFTKEDLGLRTYIESSCYDINRFNKIIPYIDICKIEFKTEDSNVVEDQEYDNLLLSEIKCLELAVESNKATYIKIVVTNSTNLESFKNLVYNISKKIKPSDILGFIIQPSFGIDQPTVNKLLDTYDIVQPMFPEVRIIPQLHKEIGAR